MSILRRTVQHRLVSAHQLSTTSSAAFARQEHPSPPKESSSSSSSSHSSQSNPHPSLFPKAGSIPKWVAGVAVAGSALGALYHCYDSDGTPSFGSRFAFADSYASTSCSDSTVAANRAVGSLSAKKTMYLFGDAFRRKIFFNYEKRIRLRSPPEKVFEYFASYLNPEGELLMTPADLMRAVVPVFPPSESNKVREGNLRGERSSGELRCDPSKFFMLFDIDSDGLISFKEYIFFVTLLSIPESSILIAFKMFDTDNSGAIDREEFKKVMELMRSANRQGATQRGGFRAGISVGESVENGGLVEYFFGKDGKKRLHHHKFAQFLRDLREEMLRLEFAHYDFKSRGSISAKDFALSMVASADIKHVSKLLDRVEEIDKDPNLCNVRITEEEFRTFAELRSKLEPFSLALFSYGSMTGLLTRKDFQRAASQVCDIHLSDNVVNLVYHVFDENRDQNLCAEEFIWVLEKRERDIGGPSDDGFFAWLSCCNNCSRSQSVSRWLN